MTRKNSQIDWYSIVEVIGVIMPKTYGMEKIHGFACRPPSKSKKIARTRYFFINFPTAKAYAESARMHGPTVHNSPYAL